MVGTQTPVVLRPRNRGRSHLAANELKPLNWQVGRYTFIKYEEVKAKVQERLGGEEGKKVAQYLEDILYAQSEDEFLATLVGVSKALVPLIGVGAELLEQYGILFAQRVARDYVDISMIPEELSGKERQIALTIVGMINTLLIEHIVERS